VSAKGRKGPRTAGAGKAKERGLVRPQLQDLPETKEEEGGPKDKQKLKKTLAKR